MTAVQAVKENSTDFAAVRQTSTNHTLSHQENASCIGTGRFSLSEMVVTRAVEDARPYETVGTHPRSVETPP